VAHNPLPPNPKRTCPTGQSPFPVSSTTCRAPTGRPEFLKARDHEPANGVALRLEPVARGAASVARAQPLGHDPLGPDGLDLLEEFGAAADHVIEVEDA